KSSTPARSVTTSAPPKKGQSKKKASAKQAAGPTPRGAKAAGSDRLGQLERLIELMVQKDVVEVELEDVGTRWRVRRTEPQTVTYAAPAPMAVAPMGMQPMAMPGGAAAAAPHAGAPAPAEPAG